MCGHRYVQTNTNNINKTGALLQTTGDKDERNFISNILLIHAKT